MNFISAKELAEKWGVDQTRVHRLAREGRIEGATLFGRNWMFPADAKKPADGRTREAKSNLQTDVFFRFPLYVNFDEKDYAPPLSDEELTLRRGQLLFQACRFAEANKMLYPLTKAENRYVRISAIYHCLCISIYENSFDFDTLLWKMNPELSQDFPYKKEMELMLYGFDADNVSYKSLLEQFTVDPEYAYHPSSYYVLALVSFIPIQNGDFSLMSKLRYDTQEFLCQQMEREGHFLEAQKMHYLLSVCYHLKNDNKKTELHIRKGLVIALEYGLFFLPALYGGWYPTQTQRVLNGFSAEFSDKVLSMAKMMRAKWTRFEETRKKTSYLSILSGNEYEYAYLANQGYTNREISQQRKISEKTVSRIFNEIYVKLGVKTKQELVELINSTHKSNGVG